MKCSQALKILKRDDWDPISQKGSHIKLKHDSKRGILIFPDHGSPAFIILRTGRQELGKGLEKKLFKQAGIKF